MTRASRHVVSVFVGFIVVTASTVPVLAQPQQPTRTLPTLRIQANNFRFCKISKTSCSTTTDTDHAARAYVGQRIKWIYKDTACSTNALCPGHNVVFAHRGTTNDTRTQGAVIFTTVFKRTGTYSYYCTHHKSEGMTGKIIVVKR